MPPNSNGRVFGHGDHQNKRAHDHHEDNEYEGSAGAVGGAIPVPQLDRLSVFLFLTQALPGHVQGSIERVNAHRSFAWTPNRLGSCVPLYLRSQDPAIRQL